jgi:hypothetical protein
MEILEARAKHLAFMVEQEENAQIGKVGVKKVLGEKIAD